MSKYLIQNTVVWRVDSVSEVEQLHETLKSGNPFDLASFSYKHKDVKSKGEIIDSYELVTAKLVFNDEKEPGEQFEIEYIGE